MQTITTTNKDSGVITTTLLIRQEEIAGAPVSIRPEFGIDYQPHEGAKQNDTTKIDYILGAIPGTFYDLISADYSKDDEKAYLRQKAAEVKAARLSRGDFSQDSDKPEDESKVRITGGDPRYSFTFKALHSALREKLLNVVYQAIPQGSRVDTQPELEYETVNTFFAAGSKFSPMYRYIRVKKVGKDFILYLPIDTFTFRELFDKCNKGGPTTFDDRESAIVSVVESLNQHGFPIDSGALKEFDISKDKIARALSGRFAKANPFYNKYVLGFHAKVLKALPEMSSDITDEAEIARIAMGDSLRRPFIFFATVKLPAEEAEYYVQTRADKITPALLLTFFANWYQRGVRGNKGFPTFIHSLESILTKNAAFTPKPRVDKHGLALTRNNNPLYIPSGVNRINDFITSVETSTRSEDGSATYSEAPLSSFPIYQLIYVDWVNQRLVYSGEYSQIIVEDIESNIPMPVSAFIGNNNAEFVTTVDTFYAIENLANKVAQVLNAKVVKKTSDIKTVDLTKIAEFFRQINPAAFTRAFAMGQGDFGSIRITDYLKGVASFLSLANVELNKYTVQSLGEDVDEFLSCYPLRNKDLFTKKLLPFAPVQEWMNSIEASAINDADWLAVINGCGMSPYETMSQIAVFKIFNIYSKEAPVIYKEYTERNKPYLTQDEGIENYIPALKNAEGLEGLKPHQRKVAGVLAKHPNFAVVAVQAGGGKTILALQDILKSLEDGFVKKPLVLCPSHLVKDYVAEAIYVSHGKLNTITFDTSIFRAYTLVLKDNKNEPNTYDFTKLKALCDNAPINTVWVMGYDAMTYPRNVGVYGTSTDSFFPKLEFMRSIGFDGVWMDESHKLKGDVTQRVAVIESLVADIPVKRLLTGTVVPNTLHDLVRQVALLAPNILGNLDQFQQRFFMEDEGDTGKKRKRKSGGLVPRPGAEREIRDFIKLNCAYINIQRKEWQAALPILEEHYVPLQLTEAQREVYNIIIEKEVNQMQGSVKGGSISTDEDGDEDGERLNVEEVFEDDSDAAVSDDDLEQVMKVFQKNLARVETFLSNPTAAVEGQDLTGDDRISPKAKAVIDILEKHLESHTHYPKLLAETKRAIDNREYSDSAELEALQDQLKSAQEAMDLLKDYNPKDKNSLNPVHPGKILIFCNTHLAVDGIYNALPAKYKAVTIKYKVENKADYELAFKTDPNMRVLIGIRISLEEGLNLQMADTLIRVDNVWTPGSMEQGMSRINRPNFKGQDFRKRIHVYNLVVDRTIDVLKTAKITSKMVTVSRFYASGTEDEAAYANIGIDPDTGEQIAPIKVSFANLRRGLSFSELEPHWNAYQELRSTEARIAKKWRESQPLEALKDVPVKHTGIIPGSKRLKRVPYIAGMSIFNADKLGLVPFGAYKRKKIDESKSKSFDTIGLAVHTAYGDGEVIKDHDHKSRLRVRFASGESMYVPYSAAFVITKKLSSTMEMLDAIAAQTGLDVLDVKLKHYRTIMKEAENKGKGGSARDDDEDEETPAGRGPRKDDPRKVVKDSGKEEIFEDTVDRSNKEIELRVARFNDLIGVVIPSSDPKSEIQQFKDYGFMETPTYSWIKVKNPAQLKKFLEGMTDLTARKSSKVVWRNQDADMWDNVYQEFKKNRTFTVGSNTFANIRNFLIDRKRRLDPDNVRPMPLVRNHELYICFDLKQHVPNMTAMKKVQAMATKAGLGTWKQEDPDLVAFVSNKADAKNVMRALKGDGWIVADEDQFLEDLSALVAKGKKTQDKEVKKPATKLTTKPSGKTKPKTTLKQVMKKKRK